MLATFPGCVGAARLTALCCFAVLAACSAYAVLFVVSFLLINIFPWRLTFSLCFFFTSSFFLSTNSVVVFVVCFWALILVVLFCYLREFWGVVFLFYLGFGLNHSFPWLGEFCLGCFFICFRFFSAKLMCRSVHICTPILRWFTVVVLVFHVPVYPLTFLS